MSRSAKIRIDDLSVAITGGARGIGLAIAKTLIAKGARVSIGDIDSELAESVATEIGAHAASVDVRKREVFAHFLQAAKLRHGRVDVMINNAGIMPMGHFLQEDPAISDAQIDINLRGVINGMQLALPDMLAQGYGHIINIASQAGCFAIPGAAVYTATKFAVVGLTEAVAAEHRDSGVHFTTIAPAIVNTELAAGSENAGFGLPRVPPQAIADAVIDVLLHPRPMVAVPEFMQTAHALYGLLPAWIKDRGRRLLGDDRILSKLDHQAHAGYEKRIAALAGNSRSST